jgi:hypothetical protein
MWLHQLDPRFGKERQEVEKRLDKYRNDSHSQKADIQVGVGVRFRNGLDYILVNENNYLHNRSQEIENLVVL